MTLSDGRITSAAELSSLVPAGGLVLVRTDDGSDPVFRALRALAIVVARGAGGRVLLFDGSTSFEPSERSARHPHTRVTWAEGPLCAWELEPLGRADLLHQVGEAGARLVPALVWIAGRPGPSAIAEAVERTGASLVILPADRQARAGRVLRLNAAWYASRIPVPVATLDEANVARVAEPLAGQPFAPSPFGRRPAAARPAAARPAAARPAAARPAAARPVTALDREFAVSDEAGLHAAS